MKTLHFNHGGTDYTVSLEKETLGHVMRYGEHKFSLPHESWRITGFSKSHLRNGIDAHITPDITPDDVNGMLVWDVDHGTTRRWGGQHCGKIPRIASAYIA